MNLLIFNALSWEQRKLGDIADRVTEKNASLEVSETFTNSAEFGIISQRDFFDHDITNKENIGNYFIVRPEDFVYNPRISVTAPVGPINRNKLGRNGVMSPLYTVFRPHDVSNTYLEYFFKTNRWHAFMQFNGDSGARSDRFSIGTDLFYEMPIPAPSFNEQEKIGSFFANLSDLITLHQSKAESWKNKKNQLSTIYWEQRKLSDEFSDFIVPMRDKPKEFGGNIPWTRIEDIEGKYLNGTLSDQYVTEETVKKMNLKIIPRDSLIVSSSATFGVVAVVTRDLITNQTFIGLVPNEKETLDYWYAYFYSDEARKYMKLQSAGSTIFYISRESFEIMPIAVPSKAEMMKIGACFDNLDNLITLHHRKLNRTQICINRSFLYGSF